MPIPNIPDVTPLTSIAQDSAINLLLASIAFEEFGLSQIINTEAEKIQYVVGTLPEQKPPTPASIAQVIEVNRSAVNTLRNVIKNQILLTFKLEDAIDYSNFHVYKNTAFVTAMFEDNTISASDIAYYHTKDGADA